MFLLFSKHNVASRKGGFTQIAFWNFNSNFSNAEKSSISLSDTVTKSLINIQNGYIAPGMEGSFEIVVDSNGSNFDIAYDISIINESLAPNNMYFIVQEDEKKIRYKTLSELFAGFNFTGVLNAESNSNIKYHINWYWPYENFNDDGSLNELTDNDDLQYAKMNSNYSFEIEIKGNQKIK